MELKVKKLVPEAVLPQKNHITDSGFDLYSVEDKTLKTGERTCIRTGIACMFPQGFGGEIRGRSGLTAKTGLMVLQGTIDSDYRGELLVIVHNLGEEYTIHKGDRIAQLIIEKIYPCSVIEYEDFSTETTRGTNGFGSSGK